MLYPLLGILGGLFCAVGDCLIDLKGRDNRTLGGGDMVNSNWLTMQRWRFQVSFLLGFLGVPCIMLGGVFLGEQMKVADENLGQLFQNSMMIGCIGGFFIHSILCIIPILFQELRKITDEEKSCHVIMVIWNTVAIPFLLFYFLMIVISSLLMITAVYHGVLDVPTWFLLLNPLVFAIMGVLIRKMFPKYCYELPGIFMPSLGLSMYGLISWVQMGHF